MRKLMACLLAALLLALPLQTLAEGAQSLTLTLETDAERLSPLVTALSGKDNPTLCESLAELINSCVLEGRWQDDTTWTAVSLKGETLLESTVSYAGEKAAFVTSLAPGYALETLAQPQMDWDALVQMDWTEEAALLTEKLETLTASLEQTEETGSFLGDTYEGGVRRVTCRLDDRTIYLMAECFLTTLEGSEAFAHAMGMTQESMAASLVQLRDSLLPGALENAYRYQLSLVYDENDALVGISLTAMEGDKQLSTLSIGPVEDGLVAVWGYGMGGVNYYLRLILLAEEAEDGTLALGLRLSVLEDPTHLGYAMVSRLDGAAAEEHMLSMAFSPAAEETAVTGEYQVSSPADSATLTWNGAYTAEPFSLDVAADVYASGGDRSLMTLRLTSGTGEAITMDMDGLNVMNMDALDEAAQEELDQAMTMAVTDMTFQLFRMLPAELLVLLMQ